MLPRPEPAAARAVNEDDGRAVARGRVPASERQPIVGLEGHILVRDRERAVDRLPEFVRDEDRDRRSGRRRRTRPGARRPRSHRACPSAASTKPERERARPPTSPSAISATPPIMASIPVKSLRSASSTTACTTCIAPAVVMRIPSPTASAARAPTRSLGYRASEPPRITSSTPAASRWITRGRARLLPDERVVEDVQDREADARPEDRRPRDP